jgi:hypothetical protein
MFFIRIDIQFSSLLNANFILRTASSIWHTATLISSYWINVNMVGEVNSIAGGTVEASVSSVSSSFSLKGLNSAKCRFDKYWVVNTRYRFAIFCAFL